MHYELRRRVLQTVTAITLGSVAALGFTPKPASAMPAVHYGETTDGMVQEVVEKGHRGHHRRHHYHHHHYYGYRDYYRPHYGYGYWPEYYYGGYAYPYPYWGRPGMSVEFSF